MTRAVPDTNIVVSGFLWRGLPRRILDAARDRIIEVYSSPVLLDELEDVLRREKFAARLAAASVTAEDLLFGYRALATVIEVEPIEPVILTDPDDDAILACALSADADVVVSGDFDLLGLKEYKGIRILTASEFLMELAL